VKRFGTCGLILLLAILPSAGSGSGAAATLAENLDQSNLPLASSNAFGGGTFFQSFTPRYRRLAAVDIFLSPTVSYPSGLSAPVTIRTLASGAPSDVIVGRAALPLISGSPVAHVVFSPPLVLEPEGQFAIEGPSTVQVVFWVGNRVDTYSGGSMFTPDRKAVSNWDLSFQTWVPDDTAPPETELTGSPSERAPSASRSASFTFTATDDLTYASHARFECSLDGGKATPCTSPFIYRSVVDGRHSWSVAAIDEAGARDPSPATAAWTVDTRPPTAPTIAGPATVRGRTAIYRFRSRDATTPPARLRYRCSIDALRLHTCGATYTANLGPGRHTIRAAAIDEAGNTSSATQLRIRALQPKQ